jgi:hypothetical protein
MASNSSPGVMFYPYSFSLVHLQLVKWPYWGKCLYIPFNFYFGIDTVIKCFKDWANFKGTIEKLDHLGFECYGWFIPLSSFAKPACPCTFTSLNILLLGFHGSNLCRSRVYCVIFKLKCLQLLKGVNISI